MSTEPTDRQPDDDDALAVLGAPDEAFVDELVRRWDRGTVVTASPEAITETGVTAIVDCGGVDTSTPSVPTVAVGTDRDVAGLYDRGVEEVVPLDPAAEPAAAAARVAEVAAAATVPVGEPTAPGLSDTGSEVAELLERVSDAFFALTPDWEVAYANESGATVIRDAGQLSPEADVIGVQLWEAIPDAQGTTFYEKYTEAMATQEPVSFVEEYEPLGVWFEVRAYPAEDGLSVYFTDVTERQRVRQAREQLLSTSRELMLAESDEAVARIVSDAAGRVLGHEFVIVYLDSECGLEPAAWSDSVETTLDGPPDTRDDGVARRAVDSGEPATYADLDAVLDRPRSEYEPVESLLVLPLGERGAIVLGETGADAFDETDTELGQLLAVNAEVAFERSRRTQELREYQTLFETVEDELYVVDGDGRFRLVSEPLADTLGYDRSTLEGEHARTVTAAGTTALLGRESTADGSEAGPETDAGDTVESEGVRRTRLRTADGEEIPVEVEPSPLPGGGTVGAVRDISRRRLRERELSAFREAITAAGIGVAVYGPGGRVDYVNEHYASLLGEKRAETAGGSVAEWFTHLDPAAFDTHWESFATGETRRTETELVRMDETTVPVEVTTTAVDIGDGVTHIQTLREITGRRERRQQADALHRIIRHNLRNDLTVVMGHANRLAEELDGEYAEWAQLIAETATELVGLSQSVQDAEQIVDRDTVRRPVDVAAVLETEVDRLRSDYDVDIEVSLPDRQYVTADETLSVALRHLLENAAEHGDGTPTISVGVTSVSDRSGWIALEISDDGPGLPEYESQVLTNGEETPLQHGSGMGLWIVHWIVSRYGGELSFDADDDGTTVRVALPTADPAPTGEVPGP